MTLQEKIGEYVESSGITMSSVADSLGISRSSLFNKLRGTSEFSLSEAFNLSRMLNITLDDLVLFIEPSCKSSVGARDEH